MNRGKEEKRVEGEGDCRKGLLTLDVEKIAGKKGVFKGRRASGLAGGLGRWW